MTRWTPLSIYLTALCYTTGIVILAGTFAVQAWSEWPTIRGTGALQPTPHESSPKHGAVKPAPRSHFEDCSPRVENAQAVSRDGQSGLAEVGSLQGEREASNRGQGRKLPPVLPTMKPAKVDTCARRGESERLSHPEHAYSSSVTGREWTPSRGTLRSDWDREPRLSKHGVRRVPARGVVLEVTETGRGPFLQAFRDGAARWLPTVIAVAEDRTDRSRDTGVGAHRGLGRDKADGLSPHHLETLAPWRPDLIAASHLCGVDIPLLASLVGRESGWDTWALSKAGARGLTQVLPSTAAEFAPGLNLWVPAENLIVGGCWLRKLIDDYRGDVRTALHAYHAGGGTVRRKQVKQVTRDYANDVILGSAN